MQAFDPRSIHRQGPGTSRARRPSALQKRARRLCGDAPRCMAARPLGTPHGMPSPPPQTAASLRQAPFFPTYLERERAAIAS